MRLIVFFFSICFSLGCDGNANDTAPNRNSVKNTNSASTSGQPVPVYSYEIVKAYPHDPRAFTQGLIFRDGFLYESTGEHGESTVRKIELATGKVVDKHELPREVFAEGLTAIGDKLYQISWRNGVAWEYDIRDFKLLREITYTGEGWGLTTDGTNLVMSDGTHLLRYIDPQTFKSVRTVPVMQSPGKPLFLLNELEWVKGEIWANIWHSEETATQTTQGQMPNVARPNVIARIDPNSGSVVGWIDLAGISPEDQDEERESENTLNGIAYDDASDRIFVTGKRWKKLYEIRLKPGEAK